jgi:hypothetical protein
MKHAIIQIGSSGYEMYPSLFSQVLAVHFSSSSMRSLLELAVLASTKSWDLSGHISRLYCYSPQFKHFQSIRLRN